MAEAGQVKRIPAWSWRFCEDFAAEFGGSPTDVLREVIAAGVNSVAAARETSERETAEPAPKTRAEGPR
jgi:hypothetical protein